MEIVFERNLIRYLDFCKVAPYCYLFSRELNFAKMERAYFMGHILNDLAKNKTTRGNPSLHDFKNSNVAERTDERVHLDTVCLMYF